MNWWFFSGIPVFRVPDIYIWLFNVCDPLLQKISRPFSRPGWRWVSYLLRIVAFLIAQLSYMYLCLPVPGKRKKSAAFLSSSILRPPLWILFQYNTILYPFLLVIFVLLWAVLKYITNGLLAVKMIKWSFFCIQNLKDKGSVPLHCQWSGG